ncbi:malate synthase G [Glaciecola siphonariae]|uniref:Malate synthase G n=1 Tax=Glaciecola siphonariae TaxID=521012 RepID=A0ABV9LZB7_9ALTE
MSAYIEKGSLKIAPTLYSFITKKALVGLDVSEAEFWQGFEAVLNEFTHPNNELLNKRIQLQTAIDEFHTQQKEASFEQYKTFLQSIGYLEAQAVEAQAAERSDSAQISTQNIDEEIAKMAGPQLVVPINNARYALNAVNARWGSLYDALYGTDALGSLPSGKQYDANRGDEVIQQARKYLDVIAPLTHGSHVQSTAYYIENQQLVVALSDDTRTTLQDPAQLKGYQGSLNNISAILLEHNGLHAEIQFDPTHPIGERDPANIKDIALESALTTIMDCEDSVAAVDAEDKTLVYQNWLGLMQGNLSVELEKNGKTSIRKMHANRFYKTPDGAHEGLTLSGRSLMFIRNVGHLMQNDAVLFNDEPVYEGIMDGIITSLIAKHDLSKNSAFENSKTGSVYIVKPKMHGSEEVAFTCSLFSAIETALKLPSYTLKIGIMDEERRTSLNLSACIAKAKERVVFINTGFLDRTGDEIHTSMLKGAFAPKAELKERPWLQAYEMANVITGLNHGLSGKAQIGKGMWPMPELMANMMQTKVAHPKAGASTAWVPSPTAATLHALHYHQVDVFEVQQHLSTHTFDGVDTILDIPLLQSQRTLTDDEIQRELDNNVQGILGYVVRWVHQGIGCSKVPDINNVGLMEDRATLRISSQHIANWLEHGLLTANQVNESLKRMAKLVDEQNQGDASYIPMLPDLDNSIGFQAAKDLIFLGKIQPNGYTEPLLHQRRREMKARLAQQSVVTDDFTKQSA